MTKNPTGWNCNEPFDRPHLTLDDVDRALNEVRERCAQHFTQYGDGIFLHPHEIVGCMFGQQIKLSQAADNSIYSGNNTDFRERCMKTLFAALVGVMSVDRLEELT